MTHFVTCDQPCSKKSKFNLKVSGILVILLLSLHDLFSLPENILNKYYLQYKFEIFCFILYFVKINILFAEIQFPIQNNILFELQNNDYLKPIITFSCFHKIDIHSIKYFSYFHCKLCIFCNYLCICEENILNFINYILSRQSVINLLPSTSPICY